MRKYIPAAIFLLLAISSVVAYNIIGSRVAPDGTLVEPFWLIPTGRLFFLISVVLGGVVGFRALFLNNKN